jgi:hypothetical protein
MAKTLAEQIEDKAARDGNYAIAWALLRIAAALNRPAAPASAAAQTPPVLGSVDYDAAA